MDIVRPHTLALSNDAGPLAAPHREHRIRLFKDLSVLGILAKEVDLSQCLQLGLGEAVATDGPQSR